eukprot:TRINITY_DN943_c0_g1_i2.p1 TRINITY_DN943_c0_g1~~TRINITY_DN943_c0_g1_i2.p1  ORF type:complete len:486 (-),score=52.91 TRINITY_DN943_c0_g1_i2:899-2356(-)
MSRRKIDSDEGNGSYQILPQNDFVSGSGGGYGAINDSSPPVPVLFQAPPLRDQPKLPIIIMMIVQFIDNLTFSIIIPSQFEFIASLQGWEQNDPRATLWSGIAIALNSAATFIFSPVCGAWTDRRSCKEVLIITSLMMLAGNLVYGFASSLWMLILGRVIVGFGAGNQVVSQVYFTYSTNTEERSLIMGIMSLVQVLAVIVGPALAPAFAAIKIHLWGSYNLDGMTLPGHFSALLTLATLALLFCFHEMARPASSTETPADETASLASKCSAWLAPKTNAKSLGIWTCVFLSFTLGVSYTVFEVVGPQLCLEFYGWGDTNVGLLYTICGIEAVVVIIIQTVLISKRFSDKAMVLWSSIGIAAAGVFFTPFVFPGNHPNGFLPEPVFLVGAGISTAAFTIGSVVLLTLFSKLIDGSEGQGIFMGYFNASRAASRVAAPIVVGLLWNIGGAYLVFIPTAVALFTGLWMNIIGYASMDPQAALRIQSD